MSFLSMPCLYNNERTLRKLLIICSWLLALLTGCATPVTQIVPNTEVRPTASVSSTSNSRKFLVFFDGTANDWRSRTNVRRLFEMVAVTENPNVISLYMDGVGSSSTPLTGGIFGFGMKERVMDGYKFLAKNRKAGDQIYIFGFSRGAHQARTLAGLMAYCGLPEGGKMSESQLNHAAEKLWDQCRKQNEASDSEWKNWKPSDGPFVARQLGLDTKVAEIEFLGIWDTVPGSQFKKFECYGEAEDKVDGIRYKSQPYPTIHVIAHALAKDEKRSEFRPLFVRQPIDPLRTTLHQVWFPGAHSDVGGGYDDSNDLAGISLNWMIDLLKNQGIFEGIPSKVYSDPAGLAHWSLGEAPGNAGSKYEDRDLCSKTLKATIDSSIAERERLSKVHGGLPIRSCLKDKEVTLQPYPISAERCVRHID